MNNTELAIQKAVEGGYVSGFMHDRMKEVDPLGAIEVYLLDPKWWQALGKTEGWGSFYDDEGMPRIYSTQGWYPDTKDFSSGQDEMMWQAYQHRLIDAIQQGRSIDEFFGEILKK
jgi:hypothetical protein